MKRAFCRSSARLLSALCPALAAGGAGAEAPALPASQLQVAMTIYAGGITMGNMDMDATFRGADYHVGLQPQDRGRGERLLAVGNPGHLVRQGRAPRACSPALYDSFYTGHAGKKQEVSLTYEGGAAPRLYADPVYSTTGYEVKPDDSKGTLDPLSAVLLIASGVAAKGGDPCALTAPVFDGRRRYNIEMTQGARCRHPHGQWPVCRQGRAVRHPLPPDRRLPAPGASRPMRAFP